MKNIKSLIHDKLTYYYNTKYCNNYDNIMIYLKNIYHIRFPLSCLSINIFIDDIESIIMPELNFLFQY